MDEPKSAAPKSLEIVGCDVELVDGGGFILTHRRSGDVAIVTTPTEAEIEGIALRVVDSWRNPYKRRSSDDPT